MFVSIFHIVMLPKWSWLTHISISYTNKGNILLIYFSEMFPQQTHLLWKWVFLSVLFFSKSCDQSVWPSEQQGSSQTHSENRTSGACVIGTRRAIEEHGDPFQYPFWWGICSHFVQATLINFNVLLVSGADILSWLLCKCISSIIAKWQ